MRFTLTILEMKDIAQNLKKLIIKNIFLGITNFSEQKKIQRLHAMVTSLPLKVE